MGDPRDNFRGRKNKQEKPKKSNDTKKSREWICKCGCKNHMSVTRCRAAGCRKSKNLSV